MVDVSRFPYLQTPAASSVNEAIDALGCLPEIIGAITDGTVVAETARRELAAGATASFLRTAHWDFAFGRARS